ncbi:MAG: mandelate racemase [Bryobacterales bacterium]|nr:mandelate racemase [Bryobacterales bacterium]
MRILDLRISDIRFPTSRDLAGSDAMNPDPDYSAAYVVLETDSELQGHGLAFTLGRGTEIVVAAAEAMRPLVCGRDLEEFTQDMGAFWRHITGDSQLRWIGPDKGAVHLATAAVVNAVWDLWAKSERKPVWRLVADMSPAEFVRLVDFRYITDALDPRGALELLESRAAGKQRRIERMQHEGYPAYTTSAGWLGYPDEKLRALCRDGLAQGWTRFKIKVGRDAADDRRRCRIIRDEIGPAGTLMTDANQVWDVGEAIRHMTDLAPYRPLWIEEPTSPDDVLGHRAIRQALKPHGIAIATGEMCQNRILFKQFLQADAIDYVQIDATRLGGVNEVLAVLLLAAKFGKPVCPHAGGVGLCEYVQHLALIDYTCVSATLEDRVIEYVDHLHEHFVHPVELRDGRYLAPLAPGYSIEMLPESVEAHRFRG